MGKKTLLKYFGRGGKHDKSALLTEEEEEDEKDEFYQGDLLSDELRSPSFLLDDESPRKSQQRAKTMNCDMPTVKDEKPFLLDEDDFTVPKLSRTKSAPVKSSGNSVEIKSGRQEQKTSLLSSLSSHGDDLDKEEEEEEKKKSKKKKSKKSAFYKSSDVQEEKRYAEITITKKQAPEVSPTTVNGIPVPVTSKKEHYSSSRDHHHEKHDKNQDKNETTKSSSLQHKLISKIKRSPQVEQLDDNSTLSEEKIKRDIAQQQQHNLQNLPKTIDENASNDDADTTTTASTMYPDLKVEDQTVYQFDPKKAFKVDLEVANQQDTEEESVDQDSYDPSAVEKAIQQGKHEQEKIDAINKRQGSAGKRGAGRGPGPPGTGRSGRNLGPGQGGAGRGGRAPGPGQGGAGRGGRGPGPGQGGAGRGGRTAGPGGPGRGGRAPGPGGRGAPGQGQGGRGIPGRAPGPGGRAGAQGRAPGRAPGPGGRAGVQGRTPSRAPPGSGGRAGAQGRGAGRSPPGPGGRAGVQGRGAGRSPPGPGGRAGVQGRAPGRSTGPAGRAGMAGRASPGSAGRPGVQGGRAAPGQAGRSGVQGRRNAEISHVSSKPNTTPRKAMSVRNFRYSPAVKDPLGGLSSSSHVPTMPKINDDEFDPSTNRHHSPKRQQSHHAHEEQQKSGDGAGNHSRSHGGSHRRRADNRGSNRDRGDKKDRRTGTKDLNDSSTNKSRRAAKGNFYQETRNPQQGALNQLAIGLSSRNLDLVDKERKPQSHHDNNVGPEKGNVMEGRNSGKQQQKPELEEDHSSETDGPVDINNAEVQNLIEDESGVNSDTLGEFGTETEYTEGSDFATEEVDQKADNNEQSNSSENPVSVS